jgi:hypothetical protein
MKHPTQEQWMELLYGELPRARKRELEAHLHACPQCQKQRTEYQSAMSRLDDWQLAAPTPGPGYRPWPVALKWAAAAAFLVTTGFATGRLSTPQADSAAIEAQIKPLEERISRNLAARVETHSRESALKARAALEAEFAQKLRQVAEKAAADASTAHRQFVAALTALRERDSTLYASLQQLETRRQADLRLLREDLERVALFTDQSVRDAQRQLVQFASHNQTAE